MNEFEISITDNQDKFSIDTDKISKIACKMLDFLISQRELSLRGKKHLIQTKVNITKQSSKTNNCQSEDCFINSIIEFINVKCLAMTLEVDIVFCDDAQIKELNTSYRNINSPTDVLSFALFADNPDENFIIDNQISLGEIIISTETAKRQADEQNKTLDEEIYFLLSHGILHLFGFDHPDEESLEDMLAIQQEMTDFAVK